MGGSQDPTAIPTSIATAISDLAAGSGAGFGIREIILMAGLLLLAVAAWLAFSAWQRRQWSHIAAAPAAPAAGQIYCASCGAANAASSRFCVQCGTELVAPPK